VDKLHVRFDERQGMQVANSTDRANATHTRRWNPTRFDPNRDHKRSITVERTKRLGEDKQWRRSSVPKCRRHFLDTDTSARSLL